MADTVQTEQAGRTFVITIDRPDVRNAIDPPTIEAIAAALDELDARDDAVAGVITGAGGTFCAGMDLKAFLKGERSAAGGRGFGGIVDRPPGKPLIAAVEGFAVGGGFEIVLACDLIVAADNAFFGLPEVTRGLVAAGGGALRLPRRVPFHLAMEWALTGARIPATTAYQARLVNRLVPPGQARPAALELAETIAANGPLAIRATKRIIHESAGWPLAEAFERQRPIAAVVSASADAREGARAFTERRRPEWTGT